MGLKGEGQGEGGMSLVRSRHFLVRLGKLGDARGAPLVDKLDPARPRGQLVSLNLHSIDTAGCRQVHVAHRRGTGIEGDPLSTVRRSHFKIELVFTGRDLVDRPAVKVAVLAVRIRQYLDQPAGSILIDNPAVKGPVPLDKDPDLLTFGIFRLVAPDLY